MERDETPTAICAACTRRPRVSAWPGISACQEETNICGWQEMLAKSFRRFLRDAEIHPPHLSSLLLLTDSSLLLKIRSKPTRNP